jgi:hypothetical protein
VSARSEQYLVGWSQQSRAGTNAVGSTAYPHEVPPIEAYKAWYASRPAGVVKRDKFTPDRYRRMARMLLNGDCLADVARAQGAAPGSVQTAMARLPKELGGNGE